MELKKKKKFNRQSLPFFSPNFLYIDSLLTYSDSYNGNLRNNQRHNHTLVPRRQDVNTLYQLLILE